jgi:hypothetical protein
MPVYHRSINAQNNQTDYKHLISHYNDSNRHNSSHLSNLPTNFNLKEITFEDIDKSVYEEFNKRFLIRDKRMNLILLDAEVSSLQNQNYEQFDRDKGFINNPMFTMFRTKAAPVHRTNPGYKKVVYAIPKQKANGIVWEEYTTVGPVEYNLSYEFKFITNYREFTNEFDEQIGEYFKNKRTLILLNNERFVLGPEDQHTLSELEIVNRENIELRSLYVTTLHLKLWCYTRDLSNMQKRERPNKYLLQINVADSLNLKEYKETLNVEEVEIDVKYPTHPETEGQLDKQMKDYAMERKNILDVEQKETGGESI